MKAQINIESVTMPAGQYWVGDPCYAVPDERWMEWLKAADYENADRFLLAELDGHPVLGINTAYGDGEYHDRRGEGTYGVDAGLIGVVPVEVAVPEGEGATYAMRLVTFAEPFKCRYDEDDAGLIVLGDIEIETDPAEPECDGCGNLEIECACFDTDDEEEDDHEDA